MVKKLLIAWIGILSLLSVILFSEVYLAASDNKSDENKSFAADIVKFTISPAKLWMYPGGSMQLIASAYDSNGKKITVTPSWKIKSDVSSFGEIDKPEGEKVIFSALTSGSGSIVAVYNNLEAEVHVKIYKPGN